MEDPKLKQTIERNLALASALGMRGTPAFVIGKQFVPGAVDAAALKQLIADARKELSGATTESPTARAGARGRRRASSGARTLSMSIGGSRLGIDGEACRRARRSARRVSSSLVRSSEISTLGGLVAADLAPPDWRASPTAGLPVTVDQRLAGRDRAGSCRPASAALRPAPAVRLLSAQQVAVIDRRCQNGGSASTIRPVRSISPRSGPTSAQRSMASSPLARSSVPVQSRSSFTVLEAHRPARPGASAGLPGRAAAAPARSPRCGCASDLSFRRPRAPSRD